MEQQNQMLTHHQILKSRRKHLLRKSRSVYLGAETLPGSLGNV